MYLHILHVPPLNYRRDEADHSFKAFSDFSKASTFHNESQNVMAFNLFFPLLSVLHAFFYTFSSRDEQEDVPETGNHREM